MKITKYTHAAMLLESNGAKLWIDPSQISPDTPDDLTGVVAIVFTHNHFDHYSPEFTKKVAAKNPNLEIFASNQTVNQLHADFPDFDNAKLHRADEGSGFVISNFSLSFFGGRHAHILPNDDKGDNVGVVVSSGNSALLYPGDSFDVPAGDSLTENYTLALPISGPWLKIGESMEYLRNIKPSPKIVFPTHDAMLSEMGWRSACASLENVAREIDAKLVALKPGESTEM